MISDNNNDNKRMEADDSSQDRPRTAPKSRQYRLPSPVDLFSALVEGIGPSGEEEDILVPIEIYPYPIKVDDSSFTPFYHGINSLYRYFALLEKIIPLHLEQHEEEIDQMLLKPEHIEQGFEKEDFEELAKDQDYFPNFLSVSIISQLFGLLETLLRQVAQTVGETKGESVVLSEKNIPYLEKCLNYLQSATGLVIIKDTERNRVINTARSIRNKYLHELSRDLPENIRVHLAELIEDIKDSPEQQIYHMTEESFRAIASLALEVQELVENFANNGKE